MLLASRIRDLQGGQSPTGAALDLQKFLLEPVELSQKCRERSPSLDMLTWSCWWHLMGFQIHQAGMWQDLHQNYCVRSKKT